MTSSPNRLMSPTHPKNSGEGCGASVETSHYGSPSFNSSKSFVQRRAKSAFSGCREIDLPPSPLDYSRRASRSYRTYFPPTSGAQSLLYNLIICTANLFRASLRHHACGRRFGTLEQGVRWGLMGLFWLGMGWRRLRVSWDLGCLWKLTLHQR